MRLQMKHSIAMQSSSLRCNAYCGLVDTHGCRPHTFPIRPCVVCLRGLYFLCGCRFLRPVKSWVEASGAVGEIEMFPVNGDASYQHAHGTLNPKVCGSLPSPNKTQHKSIPTFVSSQQETPARIQKNNKNKPKQNRTKQNKTKQNKTKTAAAVPYPVLCLNVNAPAHMLVFGF